MHCHMQLRMVIADAWKNYVCLRIVFGSVSGLW